MLLLKLKFFGINSEFKYVFPLEAERFGALPFYGGGGIRQKLSSAFALNFRHLPTSLPMLFLHAKTALLLHFPRHLRH